VTVYAIIGIYRDEEFICGRRVFKSFADADELAQHFRDEHSLAGFEYEVREFEVQL